MSDSLNADAIREALSDLEELQGTVGDLQEQMVTEDEMPDLPDDFDPVDFDPDDLPALVETQTRAYLDHLVSEDCDSDGCNALRDHLGLDPSDGDGGGDAGGGDENGGSEADGGGDGSGDGDSSGESSSGSGSGGESGSSADSWPPEGW